MKSKVESSGLLLAKQMNWLLGVCPTCRVRRTDFLFYTVMNMLESKKRVTLNVIRNIFSSSPCVRADKKHRV